MVGVALGGSGLAVLVEVGVRVAVTDGRGVRVGAGVALGTRPNPTVWQDVTKTETKRRNILTMILTTNSLKSSKLSISGLRRQE